MYVYTYVFQCECTYMYVRTYVYNNMYICRNEYWYIHVYTCTYRTTEAERSYMYIHVCIYLPRESCLCCLQDSSCNSHSTTKIIHVYKQISSYIRTYMYIYVHMLLYIHYEQSFINMCNVRVRA